MTTLRLSHRSIIILLVALSAYIFFFRIGSFALTDPDEPFYAQTAKEMLDRGEWVTPTLYGEPQFEKPILIYWLILLSYKVFGVNEFAARFPSACFALVGVIALYLLGRSFFSRRAGLIAALALATNVEYIILSRACITDMMLFTCMLLSVVAFFTGEEGKGRHWYLVSAAMLGLATLAKGPVAIVLMVTVFFLYIVVLRDWALLKRAPLGWMFLVSMAVILPWYVAIWRVHGGNFIDTFFGFQNVTRFMVPEHKTGSQFYYNIPIVLGGFFPWSAFLPFALWHALRMAVSGKGPHARQMVFTLLYGAVIFVFFTVSSTKLPTYVFPLFMSLALIVGHYWDSFLDRSTEKGVHRGMAWSWGALAAVVIVGSLGLAIFLFRRYPELIAGSCIAGALLVVGVIVALIAFNRKRFFEAFVTVVLAVLLFLVPINFLVLPRLEPFESSKEMAGYLKKVMRPGEALGSESNYRSGLAFYTGLFPRDVDKHHDLVDHVKGKARSWTVLKVKNHRQLYEPANNPTWMAPSYMVHQVGKKCIFTNMLPDDGKYILKREWPAL